MDRPLSTEVTTPVSTDGSARGHTRTKSASVKTAANGPGPTVTCLFATSLRLLNLDLLPDWPGITTSSFGQQDARARIRCTEFALYQLFKLFDPATAAEKLQPFYPPLEPLQSINLRAALYRCLNDLKKNGVLGKDTVLRKTMLDECHGDKFWEVCLAFSAIILRRQALERNHRQARPVAEELGLRPSLSKEQRASLLPLAIAHRGALKKILEEKKRKAAAFARLYDVLVDKREELDRRRAPAIQMAQQSPTEAQLERLSAVGQTLDKRWVGSKALRNALVDGDVAGNGDAVLTQPLDRLAKNGDASALQPVGLLGSLERNAANQAQRVKRWQAMHRDLMASKPASRPSTKHDSDRGPLRFDKHRNLSLRDSSPPSSPGRPVQRSEVSLSVMRYDEILTGMREELRRNRRTGSAPSQPQRPPKTPIVHRHSHQGPPRKPSIQIDTSAGAADPHRRSASQTAVPVVRPGMNRRVASRSRSYQQPKVESQRSPIPLKSEFFSPLKVNAPGSAGLRRNSTSPMSVSASPVVESPVGNGPATAGSEPTSSAGRRSSKVDSGIGLGLGLGLRDSKLLTASEKDEASENAAEVAAQEEAERGRAGFKAPELPVPKTDISLKATAAIRPSLAERTRMSMAPVRRNSSDDLANSSSSGLASTPSPAGNTTSTPPPEEAEEETAPAEKEPKPASNRRTTLADRTRQSISLAPLPSTTAQSTKKKISHKRSRTSIVYPVNQFDTPPRKTRASSIANALALPPDGDPTRRSLTPTEDLFSPDAEYDSIFKSRPRIAMSPKLSPFPDESEFSMVEIDGSPLAGAR
jgi:hypothetical protein